MTRILLCEGVEGAFVPETGYCRQGQKVWFAFGKPAKVQESFQGMTLVESIDEMELEERTLDGRTVKMPKGGVWVVEGPAQASDKKNANQRYYPREIWDRIIKDQNSPAQQAIRERAMVGHLEHPADGRTDGNKLALVVTHAELRESGDVFARFELLDTPEGLRLQEYTRKKVKWGVSSRGTGSVDEKGRVDPRDYVLQTWDAVMQPSVTNAIPRLKEEDHGEDRDPVRSSVKEGRTSVTTESLDSDTHSCIESVLSACDSSIDELDSAGRANLRAELLKESRQLAVAPASPRVQNAMARALLKLSVLDESDASGLDDLIETAVRDATHVEDRADAPAVSEAIQEIRRAHEATAREAEELRTKLEEAESRLARSREVVDELRGQLAEATVSYAGLSGQLTTAQALLAERPARESGLMEAVDAVVMRVPQLERFQDILESASTVQGMHDLVERLLPFAMASQARVEPVELVERSRPTLPHGAVRSETDVHKPATITESRRPVSRGVRLAVLCASKK